ncbi:asparagine-rich protein-like [Odontomachus brunneus]|uniref:asparagine-rich protein-like n=1 Tax=Odontomachus brunneus TaxID=486640 RepID=UPI0013F23B38|nr:asparagine-rich protein-like [Odontomachus brunneus]
MSTVVENAEEVNVISEKETSLHCAEQLAFPQIEQVNEVTMSKTIVKLGTNVRDLTTQSDENNVDINLDRKELENEPFRIYKDKIIKHEEISSSIKNDIMYEKPVITTGKMTSKVNRRVSVRKAKKTSQVADNNKENIKKVNTNKVVRQKASTKKSCKTSLKLCANQILKEDKESLENHTKVDLCKINTEGCLNYNFMPFTHVKSQTKMYDTKFSCPSVARQQELNQYNLENNTNILQHLDYNNLKYTNQQAMSATNSWMTVPKPNESFTLNNTINTTQTETGQSSYINDKHHTLATDYSWRQNENPYFNSIINSMDSYKLLAENKIYHPYNIYNPNYIMSHWNNLYMQNLPRTNATFQQAINNVAPNYSILPINASNNFLNPAVTSFNPFYYYPPLLTDDNLKKLYYTNLNNNGRDFTVKKENMMPLPDNWHHSNSLIPSNNSLNIPATTSTWYNAPSSSFLDASTATTSDVDKEFKCVQNTYLTNHYNTDMTKASVYKDQWREKDQFVSYVKPALQNTLPAITTILTPTPIGTHAFEPYKADNGLASNLTHHSNTVTSTDDMMSNIADFSSETTGVDVPKEVPCIYTKDKKLISEVLESIL